jgi:hypothetical protein
MFGTERCTVCFTITACRSARILLASRTDRAYLSLGRLPIQNIAESFIAQVPNYQISAAWQALEQRHSPSGQGDGLWPPLPSCGSLARSKARHRGRSRGVAPRWPRSSSDLPKQVCIGDQGKHFSVTGSCAELNLGQANVSVRTSHLRRRGQSCRRSPGNGGRSPLVAIAERATTCRSFRVTLTRIPPHPRCRTAR